MLIAWLVFLKIYLCYSLATQQHFYTYIHTCSLTQAQDIHSHCNSLLDLTIGLDFQFRQMMRVRIAKLKYSVSSRLSKVDSIK